MARRGTTTAATRLARLEEWLADLRRARAGELGPVVAYVDDDERAVAPYVAQRARIGADVAVVVRSLAAHPAQ